VGNSGVLGSCASIGVVSKTEEKSGDVSFEDSASSKCGRPYLLYSSRCAEFIGAVLTLIQTMIDKLSAARLPRQ